MPQAQDGFLQYLLSEVGKGMHAARTGHVSCWSGSNAMLNLTSGAAERVMVSLSVVQGGDGLARTRGSSVAARGHSTVPIRWGIALEPTHERAFRPPSVGRAHCTSAPAHCENWGMGIQAGLCGPMWRNGADYGDRASYYTALPCSEPP